MKIPFREIGPEDKEIVRIEAKKNKRSSVMMVIFGIVTLIALTGVAIGLFVNYEGASALVVLACGIFFGGIFLLVGLKGNKPVVGICEVKVAGKEEKREDIPSSDADGMDTNIDYYLTFAIPGTEEQYRTSVSSNYYKNAMVGGKAYLLKTSKGKVRVYVPSKREKKSIEKEAYAEKLKSEIENNDNTDFTIDK